jgi:patatin-like phospholipase/acyl hydrolase
MAAPLRILSIDGGGIRGIVPAMILQELETRATKPTCQLFDLIAGTSTGGILALGLTKPAPDGRPQYPAGKLLEFYETEGPTIFHQSLGRRLLALGHLLEAKYPASNIEGVLRRYFGETRLAEALTDVVIPSYELEGRMAWFFRSRRARTDQRYNFLMREVSRATSAAPTYFPPLRLDSRGPDPDTQRKYYALVDGGVFANNPSLCAYVEAMSGGPESRDCLMVSIGTGQWMTPIQYNKARHWGLAGWARPILDVVFDGISDTIEYQLRRVLAPRPDGSLCHFRFQAELNQHEDALDDASPANIAALKRVATAIIERNDATLTELAQRLRS